MRYWALTAALLLSACADQTIPPFVMTTPFRDSDFAPWQGAGASTISGQAFLRTVGGEVRTCAGSQVALLPATHYNQELVAAIRFGHKRIEGRTADADKYSRLTICDAQGNFEFKNVPARDWLVWTTVEWGVPTEYYTQTQGGDLIKDVAAAPGENKVFLTATDEAN